MRILPQFARFAPCPVPLRVRMFRLAVRLTLLAFGGYIVYHGEQTGKAEAIRGAAKMKAFREKLDRESAARMKEFNERADEEMAEIYRDLNTIASYAGLGTVGDES